MERNETRITSKKGIWTLSSKKVGYTAGVFDLFHIGHLNLLKRARSGCDKLIVGCSNDEVVLEMKNKLPVIPFIERVEILKSIIYVDDVVEQKVEDYNDKMKAWKKYRFHVMFVGSDWQNTDKWNTLEDRLKNIAVDVIYLSYTQSTSSTKINKILDEHL